MKRVFVAVPLPIEVRRGLRKLYKDLERKHWQVKWEEPRKLHITLAFLGMVAETQVEQIVSAVAGAMADKQVAPFTLGLKGLGAFPNLVWPKTIWLGLRGDLQALARMAREVRTQLGIAGFQLEQKPFQPHVTLGRIKRDIRLKYREDMGKQVAKMVNLNLPLKFEVNSVVVYESVMKRGGLAYEKIAVAPLNKRPCIQVQGKQ